ncbi:putative Fe-S cluster assembly protein SufT [Puniceicoccales bacterium CK1056]|uniref:Putative Fe-S cluster assembly protein SufT n=1 Tax=Oceanipulchritudo coccoides TaxID=2706888 RepID=A0A6B2LYS7_9BACT|nr:putative Fe-S cluster assembly protein SufT [Oceanipulchritudo coccoides]NDV60917.1 putative Fe-S cluster assembly protein SufT [Oceanipulchritudo coccoides]
MDSQRTVSRDITATIVPYGDQVTIPSGTVVSITHRLGGNFTVTWEGGMAQIRGSEADAIGEELPEEPEATTDDAEAHARPPSDERVWEALKKVYDPEIPVNIVDLGLVYSMEIRQDPGTSLYFVEVNMTLTAPGCGMGPAIAQDAKYKVEQVPGVAEAKVDIVWDPPWHQDMISEEGKMELGLI